jgi:uncharacterized protein YuzB (UPF0349 family)
MLEKKLSKAFPDATIMTKSCIDMCKVCKNKPAASVHGEKLKAKDIAKLISKIEKA